MASLTFPTELPPQEGSPGLRVGFEINKAEFGDGYKQISAKGINSKREVWDFMWVEENVDAQTLKDFLDARGGFEPFFFTPPGEVTPKLWTCEGYTHKPRGALATAITAQFIRWFGEETP